MKTIMPLYRTWASTSECDDTTDIIISCGEDTLYAHQDAVCAHSQVLQDARASTEVREPCIRIAHTNEADS